jgi:sulfide:quinone oxidoreductase
MTKMRLGVALPWFERLGLKAMFGVDLVKPVMAFDQEPVASA